jgi:ferredoxin
MAKKVWVDEDECISCGICVGNLPEVFRFAGNGKAEAYAPSGASEDVIQQEAIDVCPVACIYWQE